MAEKKKWVKVGTLLKSKAGSLYIKVDDKLEGSVTLTKGMSLNLKDPRKENLELAERGFISMEEAESRNAKIPEYVKYNITLPPSKD